MSASKLRIYHRLQIAAHTMRKSADRTLLDAAGVTVAQAAVLAIVSAGANVTQRDVASALRLNESAVAAMVSRLMNLRLLQRTQSQNDSRAWSLHLTERGAAARTAAQRHFATINSGIESALTVTEIDRLAHFLDRLTEAFTAPARSR
jgi:DNA-binding MarR family transcriptional regulator